MGYQFQYFDEVFTDIQKAKNWYKERKEGLEIEFSKAVSEAIKHIEKMPTAYTMRYRNVRIAHVKIFPYNIHFYIDYLNEIIVITAIIHNKRHSSVAGSRI